MHAQKSINPVLAPFSGFTLPGFKRNATPTNPITTPSQLKLLGRLPSTVLNIAIQNGRAEIIKAAIPVGTYLSPNATEPIAIPKSVPPINEAFRNSARGIINDRQPFFAPSTTIRIDVAAKNLVPIANSGGIDSIANAIP